MIDAAVAPLEIRPVVVGGLAVYFWTANDAFLTQDIDLVMPVPAELHATLGRLGFERSADQRHWQLPGTDVFVEAPASELDADARVTSVQLASGRIATVLSRADVLLDRLAEFQATGHEIVAQQAIALLAAAPPADVVDVRARAPDRRVDHALRALAQIATEMAAGREPPAGDELHRLARAALRAEYTR